MSHRYRYTGRQPNTYVPRPQKPDKLTIIKPIYNEPYVKDRACLPNIYDRAIIRAVPDELKSAFNGDFVIETFSNLILVPVNLSKFQGYQTNFNDGDIVAFEAEDLSSISTCTYPINAIPVNIFKINRSWSQLIRTVTGVVSYEQDNNGYYYYMLTETHNISSESSDPYFNLYNSNYQYDKNIYIHYEIFNIMNVIDPAQTLNNLVGKTVTVTYIDYGKETKERIGLPIVIIEHAIN